MVVQAFEDPVKAHVLLGQKKVTPNGCGASHACSYALRGQNRNSGSRNAFLETLAFKSSDQLCLYFTQNWRISRRGGCSCCKKLQSIFLSWLCYIALLLSTLNYYQFAFLLSYRVPALLAQVLSACNFHSDRSSHLFKSLYVATLLKEQVGYALTENI